LRTAELGRGTARGAMGDDWTNTEIDALHLSEEEKAGLQVYRNYTKAFERYAIDVFVQELDKEDLDLTACKRVVRWITTEEPRVVPIVACAFADEVLRQVLEGIAPEDVPGGRASLFGGYGPLSSLAQRIQVAYAFRALSQDLLKDLDRLRVARNTISHSWNLDDISEFYSKGAVANLYPIEETMREFQRFSGLAKEISPLEIFRIRTIWAIARLRYEAATYNRAKQRGLDPYRALYGKASPRWLAEISGMAVEATLKTLKMEPQNSKSLD